MSTINVTDIVLNEEAKELQEMIKNDPKAKAAYEQFDAERKLRRELIETQKKEVMN